MRPKYIKCKDKIILIDRLAIRSSGVGEDGKDNSCAGQNDTILGVSGEKNVIEAILRCWSSLYSFRSVQYRWGDM